MKRTLNFILLFVALQFSYAHLTAQTFSAYGPVGHHLTFSASGNNATVTGIIGWPNGYYASQVYIPATVNYNGATYNVTAIGNGAFANKTNISSVIILGTNMTSIGNSAFFYCTGLSSISMPSTVTVIGDDAFNHSGLNSIEIPNSTTTIGNFAFDNCASLTSVIMGDSVQTLGIAVFRGCNNLSSIVIPNTITAIPWQAFNNCTSLSSVSIPSSVTVIGEGAFGGCSQLQQLFLTNVESIGYEAFAGSGLTTINLGDSLTTIGGRAFADCSSLSSINIPSSLINFSGSAFVNCSNITSVIVSENNTHYDSRENCNAIIETSSNKILFGCQNTQIPVTITNIGANAFRGQINLSTVIIPSNMDSIGQNAFRDCSNLLSITSYCTTPPSIESGYGFETFRGTPNEKVVHVLCGLSTAYQASWGNLNFQEMPINLSVDINSNNETMGSVTVVPDDANRIIRCDSSVVFYATPNYGYHFFNWSSGSVLSQDTVFLTHDTIITAYWERNIYRVTGVAYDTITGYVTGGDSAFYQDTLILEAIPNYGYHFAGWNPSWWTSNGIDFTLRHDFYDNPATIIVSGDATYSAHFVPNQYTLTLDVDTIIHGSASGAGLFEYLDNCTISVTANNGYHFTQWNDGNTDNPRTITLTQDTFFTAMFAPNQYTITGISANETRGVVTGGSTVDYLDSITITATANYGFHFTRWQDYSTDNPRRIQVTQNKTYTAYFDFNQYSITLDVDTNIHGTVNGGGNYNFLSNRTITATPNYGYHFTQWNDGDTNNPRVLTLTQDTAFTALFTKNTYTITAISNDTIRGVVTGSTLTEYLDSVTIVAIPNYGYHFTAWNDGDTTNPRTIETIKDSLFTAYFDYNQYSITLNVDTNIHGLVTGGGLYNYTSEQTITATPNYGYHFTSWNDGDTTNPRTITLTQDTLFTALFAKNSYSVSVVSADTIWGNVTGNTTTEYLNAVSIAATANYGYHFLHWNDGDTTNPRVITLTQDTLLTAYFAKNWYSVICISDNETMGYVTGSDTAEYLDSVSLLATSNYGYHFSSWNDGDTNNPRVVCLTQDTSFTALFAKNQYTLTVQSNDEIQGSVSDGGVFDYLDTATIIASASEHYHFVRWDDGNMDNPREYVIVGDATLTAIFAIDTHTVSVTSNDIARGMVDATGTEFSYGTPCTVTATAYTGYVFSRWSNGITANPYTFAVLEDTELTAIFEEEGTQGIDDVFDINGFVVYYKDRSIYICGIEGQPLSVYGIDGRIIVTKHRATEQETIHAPSTGVYFIKVGEYPARKVVVVR